MEWTFILRLVAAGVLGGIIGFEREYRSKEAGIRTHFLVALGSALFMIISQYGFGGVPAGRFDAARVAAQVVTGIGFIGAGVIIFQRNSLRGLTTAAGLWVTAAIGLACGGGMYIIGAATTALVLLVLEVMHHFMPQFGEKQVTVTFISESREALLDVIRILGEKKLSVRSYSVTRVDERRVRAVLELRMRHDNYVPSLGPLLEKLPGVEMESIE